MINNDTYQRETLSERPIRQPLMLLVVIQNGLWTKLNNDDLDQRANLPQRKNLIV